MGGAEGDSPPSARAISSSGLSLPLDGASHRDVTAYTVTADGLSAEIPSGRVTLKDKSAFAGYSGDPAAPDSVLLRHHGLHVEIIIDRNTLKGSVNLVRHAGAVFGTEQGSRELAARSPRPDLRADPNLPADTRLWAALQDVSGGTWGGCVYDVDAILRVIESGKRALADTLRGTEDERTEAGHQYTPTRKW